MKILESVPRRYDVGINILSLGGSKRVNGKIASLVKEGERVLDIGCGTGELALMMAERGAYVVGFDVSEGMLEVAREKASSRNLGERLRLEQLGVAEMDKFGGESFDKVTAILVFSELSREEQMLALRESYRILRRGGQLIIADEVAPELDTCCLYCLLVSSVKKIGYHLLRLPLVVITYALTQTTTKAIRGLEEMVTECGFKIISTWRDYSLKVLIAEKGEKTWLLKPS
jgi:demethylmenaquinone methyltransferase/2-methoxy-6-polyprenyl-1,4-benzoquinol methylase